MFHLPAGHEQEVPHDGHTVVTSPGRHGCQLAPVRTPGDAHVLLRGGVEEPQLPYAADLSLPPTDNIQRQRPEPRDGAGRLAKGLREYGPVVIQGFLHQGGDGAGVEEGVTVGHAVQSGDLHQPVAHVLQQFLHVLVFTVMLQPTHQELQRGRVAHQYSAVIQVQKITLLILRADAHTIHTITSVYVGAMLCIIAC